MVRFGTERLAKLTAKGISEDEKIIAGGMRTRHLKRQTKVIRKLKDVNKTKKEKRRSKSRAPEGEQY